MAHSIAIPVISVPPLRNFEHKVKISGFVRGCFRPSTVKSNKVSRYEKSAAVETDPVFFTAARRYLGNHHRDLHLIRAAFHLLPQPRRRHERKLGSNFVIPSGSVPVFSAINALILVPIYEKLIVPFLQSKTTISNLTKS